MLHKKKCPVCGHRFHLDKDSTYTVVPPRSLSEVLTKAQESWTAIDCPNCGCQVLLAPRSAKIVENKTEEVKPDEPESDCD